MANPGNLVDYERPGVQVEQVFDQPAPIINGTTLIPCTVGPRFEVLNLETIAEEDVGYPGDPIDIAVPVSEDVLVDEESIDVFLDVDGVGIRKVADADFDYDENTAQVNLSDGITVQDNDGNTISFSQQNRAAVLIDLIGMYVRRPSDSVTERQDIFIIQSVEQLENQIGEIVPENPLAFGMFFALATTDTVVTGMPVLPETDDLVMQRLDQQGNPDPQGDFHHYLSVTAFESALERLEVFDVYSIAPSYPSDTYFNPELKPSLIGSFHQHCLEMSEPDRRGERITTHVNPNFDDSLDTKIDIAAELKDFANDYNSRRLSLLVPPKAEVPVDGNFEILSSEMLCNAIAGMDSFYPPQQPFTRLPMNVPVNRVIGSNDLFNEFELDIIATGGNYIVVQDGPGQPPRSRHQQTTHTQFVEKNERSIVKVVDYAAKLLRREMKEFVGRYNITKNLLSSMSMTADGVLNFLEENGHVRSADLIDISQDEDEPDQTNIKVSLEVLFPNNHIDITIVV